MALSSEEVLAIFEQKGAYLRGHFRLTSGLHSGEYLQCARVLEFPDTAEKLGSEIADHIEDQIDVVVSPAIGGLIVGYEVARALEARFLFTERDPATRHMSLRRGFELREGERALVVEDVVTTGGSSVEVIDILLAAGVHVAGAASIIDRSGGKANLGVQRIALATLNPVTWTEPQCPLCREGAPLTKPGSRPA
ncbi:MAG TPA: orotate phosphoribosyltransferase [Bryobacteraceae bacterium]|nr:orotate phosphoribosyltransferase [Bryobacteraceae bacterium]